jgi:site-specific DNA recombinase
MNKKAVKYLRFSSEEQSHFSIERQEMITSSWMTHANVEAVDCFVDQGWSATNFDHPDFIKLNAFIEKNYRNIDYLVVSDLTRFSREVGDAVNIAKKIQKTYGIRIVSAGRGNIYDCTDHNSFFMMGLEFLLGNTENLKRINDINSGIYAAKAINQRYIGPRPPFGYRREGRGKNSILVPVPEEAAIVQLVYHSYLKNVPIPVIEADAKDKGLRGTRNSLIEGILASPIYSSQQYVKSYKDQPGGLFPLKDQEPIIDLVTWNQVQEKMKRKVKVHVRLHDELPLRGVLHCHCGKLLTGAPSRGKSGKYWYYYKCNVASQHNNFSAIRAHDQLLEAFNYMSLPPKMVKSITLKSEFTLEARTKDKANQVAKKQAELEKIEADVASLERKWIAEQINFETYNRWHNDFTKQRNYVRAQIDQLNKNTTDIHKLLMENISWLTDMSNVYKSCRTTLQKQELIRLVFDNSLYFEDHIYRTPYLIPELAHNELKMREKNLLYIEKKRENRMILSSGGGEGIACGDPWWGSPTSIPFELSGGFQPPSFFVLRIRSERARLVCCKQKTRNEAAGSKDTCGGEGIRTPVQTYSPKAFYMLIPALIVGKQQEPDKPIISLAGWS